MGPLLARVNGMGESLARNEKVSGSVTGPLGKIFDLETKRPGFGAWLYHFPSLGLSLGLCKMGPYVRVEQTLSVITDLKAL